MAAYPNDPLWRRHLAEIVVVGIGLVLVVGLWLDNRDDGLAPRVADTTSTVADRTTTTAPAGDAGPETADTAETTDTEPEATSSGPSAEDLLAAVLRISDLPKGWSKASIGSTPVAFCDDFDPVADAQVVATASAAFSVDGGARVMGGTVASFRGTAPAEAFVQRMRGAASGCARTGGSFVVSRLADVGEEAVGVTFSVSNGPTTTRGVLYLARKGARTAMITSTGDDVDEGLALRALRAEVARL